MFEPETLSIARSVYQAQWNGKSEPPETYRPGVYTFILWVGYAKRLARAYLSVVAREAVLRELVIEAYAGDPPTNGWRIRAERLNAWPGAARLAATPSLEEEA